MAILDSQFEKLLSEIGDIPKPVDIQMFANKCMDWFISFCASSKQLVNDWALMQEKDPEVMRYFNTYNDTLLSAFVAALDNPNVDQKNLVEKVYLLLALSDRLGVEYVFEHTSSISLEILREEMVDILTYLLSKPE